ncbi:hypothetical protein LOD99_115 [Oopsacas minuta]|uniref:Aminotransferase class V domain-containing protein n=1 Tax=Oopsacas minuta TaxID=111878 RepID=A0AAV7K7S3_9METZ|nr:hypothetical protein LOD99_115 [Oopsacas minuta]
MTLFANLTEIREYIFCNPIYKLSNFNLEITQKEMSGNNIINFSPGPSKIAKDVLEACKVGIDNFLGSGLSVMEISHRGKHYAQLNKETEKMVRDVMEIPDNYKVLFISGGGTGQFAGVPLNLMRGDQPKADYVITGTWSAKAAKEAEKYLKVFIAIYTIPQSLLNLGYSLVKQYVVLSRLLVHKCLMGCEP